jgi:hypothetical protein
MQAHVQQQHDLHLSKSLAGYIKDNGATLITSIKANLDLSATAWQGSELRNNNMQTALWTAMIVS